MRVAIDVDITLVDTGYEWWDWLKSHMKVEDEGFRYFPNVRKYFWITGNRKLPYALDKEFDGFEDTTSICPYSFWKQDDLYDELTPLPNSVNVIKRLVDAGHEIVFISHCHGDHFKSKVDFLRRHFPFADIGGKGGFIATKEKHLVDVDIMIDDRSEYLLKFKDSVIKVYFGSIYQDAPFNKYEVDFITNDDCNLGWFELESYFEELGII